MTSQTPTVDSNEQQRIERIEQLLRQMFEADNAYGCGFYNDPAWRNAYRELAKLSGVTLE
jgi:hypothetical protein